MKPINKTQHVVPSVDGGWSVKKGGASRATRKFGNKTDAIAYAEIVAKNTHSELFIHGCDGAIQRKDSYTKKPHISQKRK